MDSTSHEPLPPAPTPRPCSTPHSAPAEWLKQATEELLPREDQPG